MSIGRISKYDSPIIVETMEDKLRRIAKFYGYESQALKLIEEMSELIQALIKGDKKHIEEELADVEVMLYQVKYLGDFCIEEQKHYKVERQLKRMEKAIGGLDECDSQEDS